MKIFELENETKSIFGSHLTCDMRTIVKVRHSHTSRHLSNVFDLPEDNFLGAILNRDLTHRIKHTSKQYVGVTA